MQDFRTILPPIDSNITIQPNSKFICLGSCFANHIGEKLDKGKWSTLTNPFGILYHPIPILNGLEKLLGNEVFESKDFFFHQEQWHSFHHHGNFSNTDRQTALDQANIALSKGSKQLENADILMITFGTAYGFVYRATKQVVSNCHKLPNKDFDRILNTPDFLLEKLSTCFQSLEERFPNLKIILTVSPVRHIRDGLIENQRSKSTLLLVLAALEKQFKNICYFPAYELLMDDLRDYRFYKNDMIHPSDLAVNYIWQYFIRTFFTSDSKNYLSRIEKIQRALSHRPIQPQTDAHQTFLKNTLQKIDQLSKEYKHLDFEIERNKLNTELTRF